MKERFTKKVIFIVFALIWMSISILYPQVEAMPLLREIYTVDHGQNHEKAKKWAQIHFKAWQNKLSLTEQHSLKQLLIPIDKVKERKNLENINHQLKVYGGDLTGRPVDIPIANANLQEHIDHISHVLARQEGKLTKSLIVYKNETIKDVLHTDDHYYRFANGLLDKDKIKRLKTDFSYGQSSEFRIYDLFEDINQTDTIKWKIHLPAGTHAGLIQEDKIVIAKDSAFKVTAIKIIIQRGKQLLRIEAKLIPKETVENKNNLLTTKISQDFHSRLQLPEEKKVIHFKLTGAANHLLAKKIPRLLDKFIGGLHNPSLLGKILHFIMEKKGHLLFTDRALYSLPVVYEPYKRTLKEVKKMFSSEGNYNIGGNRVLSIHLPADLKNSPELSVETLLHEFGHVVDNYGAITLQENEVELSATTTFKEIFAKEGKNLTKYGKTNPQEFFAEAFWMMHDENERKKVQQNARETYDFISQKLEILSALKR